LKWYYFRSFLKVISLQKNISFSFFQYSDRTIGSTETNDTSTDRSDTRLFGTGKSEGVALSGGLHAYLLPKDIGKKVNLMEESQDAKKKNFNPANFILMLWGKCMLIAFELQQGLLCSFTNCQT
jgi:hypothetical protein